MAATGSGSAYANIDAVDVVDDADNDVADITIYNNNAVHCS